MQTGMQTVLVVLVIGLMAWLAGQASEASSRRAATGYMLAMPLVVFSAIGLLLTVV